MMLNTGHYYSKLEQGMSHEDIMEIIWATAHGRMVELQCNGMMD